MTNLIISAESADQLFLQELYPLVHFLQDIYENFKRKKKYVEVITLVQMKYVHLRDIGLTLFFCIYQIIILHMF